MENKFKSGDKVIYTNEASIDDWRKLGRIDHDLVINEEYTIEVWEYDEDFKLSNRLKQELNKLKETILSGRYIKLTKKDRRIFESLCKKFEIDIPEGNRIASLEYLIVYAKYRLGYTGQRDLCFFIKMANNDIAIDFKDLIEPFKKFRDEIL